MRVHSGTAVAGRDWVTRAACRNGDPDMLFVPGAEQHRTKAVCKRCPVKLECLAEALQYHVPHGVWGGLTERERRRLLQRRPDVTDWRSFLEAEAARQGVTR